MSRTACRAIRTLLVVLAPGSGLVGGMHLHAQAPDSLATVRGTVVEHETGTPVWGAAVSLAAGPTGTQGIGTRVTDEEGGFLFREVPPGLYRLTVTRIGYATRSDTLRVEVGSDLQFTLPVSTSPVALEPIVVSTRRRDLGPMRGFESRRRRLGGTFMTREEIEAAHAHRFTDLLRMVPGARVVPSGPFGHQVTFRGGCVPTLIMDGVRVGSDPELDFLVQPSDLEAVEIYRGASVPVEFGLNPCGAIVVWTRGGDPVGNPEGFWRRALVGLGFLTLTFIFAR